MSDTSSHPRWEALLTWLIGKSMNINTVLVEARKSPGAGYGLFAINEIPPSTPIMKIPATALINIRTLGRLYPKARPPLTATQLISLHLFLHRPNSDNDLSTDSMFGPYISIFPSNFDSHPLTWARKTRRNEDAGTTIEDVFMKCMPEGVREPLISVEDRFCADWHRVSRYLRTNSELLRAAEAQGRRLPSLNSLAAEQEFLWAWLNVNTRCVYHRLCQSRKDPNNMTMCPILDLANHTDRVPYTTPQSSKAEIWDRSPIEPLGEDFILLSPSSKSLCPGEEVFLRYGAHSDQTLFIEYGFINEIDEDALKAGRINAEADISYLIKQLFEGRGDVGMWMKNVLTEEGYWGDWTIHSMPEPAHPSFRLISVLRLYHSVSPERGSIPHDDDILIEGWRDTILGKRDMISPENEQAWKNTLAKICRDIEAEANVALERLSQVGEEWPKDGWVHYSRSCLVMLWRQQQHVAWLVHESIEKGEEF